MTKREYRYGMRLRGASPGAQPKAGLVAVEDDPSGTYYNVLVYSRRLALYELKEYELEYLWGKRDGRNGV